MNADDFSKLVRGDVLRWTEAKEPGIGLVTYVRQGYVHVLWENGCDDTYTVEDARSLERGC